MFRKLALVAALAALFSGAEATKNHTKSHTNIKTDGQKVKSSSKTQKVKEFSICLYIPYGSGNIRRLDAEQEERDLGEVNAAGQGFGYFDGLGVGENLYMDYLSAIMYDCDTDVELGTYGVSCTGDRGVTDGYGYYYLGEAVQSDCEHNFAFQGEPGSALVIHTSDGLYGTTVTTLGGSGKFYKSEVVNAEPFEDETNGQYGFTLSYKTRGYNPLYWKHVNGPKKNHDRKNK